MRSHPYIAILVTELTALVISSAALAVESPSASDSTDVFQRVKARMAEHLAHLPNYTCHETIDRMMYLRGNFQHVDIVDLEVAFVGSQELFARAGEDKFGEQPIDRLVHGGTIGNHALGSHIDIIFSNDMADFKFVGECKKDGQRTVRFDLRVPLERSTFRIRHNGVTGVSGYQGSVWVDRETLDLVRVDFKVTQIPSYLGLRLIEESMHYAKLKIGSSDFDLPRRSELAAMDTLGNYTLNKIELTTCREFNAESVVKYLAPTEGTANRDQQGR